MSISKKINELQEMAAAMERSGDTMGAQSLREQACRLADEETMKFAIENDCFDGETATCDDCGKTVCRELAYIWADELVICKECKPTCGCKSH